MPILVNIQLQIKPKINTSPDRNKETQKTGNSISPLRNSSKPPLYIKTSFKDKSSSKVSLSPNMIKKNSNIPSYASSRNSLSPQYGSNIPNILKNQVAQSPYGNIVFKSPKFMTEKLSNYNRNLFQYNEFERFHKNEMLRTFKIKNQQILNHIKQATFQQQFINLITFNKKCQITNSDIFKNTNQRKELQQTFRSRSNSLTQTSPKNIVKLSNRIKNLQNNKESSHKNGYLESLNKIMDESTKELKAMIVKKQKKLQEIKDQKYMKDQLQRDTKKLQIQNENLSQDIQNYLSSQQKQKELNFKFDKDIQNLKELFLQKEQVQRQELYELQNKHQQAQDHFDLFTQNLEQEVMAIRSIDQQRKSEIQSIKMENEIADRLILELREDMQLNQREDELRMRTIQSKAQMLMSMINHEQIQNNSSEELLLHNDLKIHRETIDLLDNDLEDQIYSDNTNIQRLIALQQESGNNSQYNHMRIADDYDIFSDVQVGKNDADCEDRDEINLVKMRYCQLNLSKVIEEDQSNLTSVRGSLSPNRFDKFSK
eukprot:403364201